MTNKRPSTRRSFLKSSAMLALPLAGMAPAAVIANDDFKSELAKLKNEAAIRELHHYWLRQISTGESQFVARLLPRGGVVASGEIVRSIAPDHTQQPGAIQIAAGGRTARGRFHCIVSFERAIPQDSTLAQMAHAQGDGFIRRTERRILETEYTNSAGQWAVSKAEIVSVDLNA
ncbi:MAG: hypothetical protein KGL02_06380 [Acidobacteriota bacterium]|nr:hypothetical protein [Acidobacteriota bacterium]MDE3170157.1 hypothetical protein [Acidobacteriota bacterium]